RRDRVAGVEPLDRLAAPHLRATRLSGSAILAPPPRTGLGTLCPAPALALRLRPRAERFGTHRVASRLRRRAPTSARLGRHLRHTLGPRPTHPPDHLARRRTRRTDRRDPHREPRRGVRPVRPR